MAQTTRTIELVGGIETISQQTHKFYSKIIFLTVFRVRERRVDGNKVDKRRTKKLKMKKKATWGRRNEVNGPDIERRRCGKPMFTCDRS